eukprot:augustus_masked-scaffold_21-processed-gene-5.9-mRNA-1 protein AED:1.00 eAED:1.00 QI:0/0/0/0/1/1/2/0/135
MFGCFIILDNGISKYVAAEKVEQQTVDFNVQVYVKEQRKFNCQVNLLLRFDFHRHPLHVPAFNRLGGQVTPNTEGSELKVKVLPFSVLKAPANHTVRYGQLFSMHTEFCTQKNEEELKKACLIVVKMWGSEEKSR